MIKKNELFDFFANDPKSQVIEVFPLVYGDSRGSFAEVLKSDMHDHGCWLSDLSWIKQVNRSKSCSMTVRGCHAQKAPYCQGKLVSATAGKVYDIITDARPDSQTFGVTQAFVLDSNEQNMLWVPRGFLHAFAVPSDTNHATFEYFCDNVYHRESEVGIAPMSLFPACFSTLADNDVHEMFKPLVSMIKANDMLLLSEKDKNGLDYNSWMSQQMAAYSTTSTLWYR